MGAEPDNLSSITRRQHGVARVSQLDAAGEHDWRRRRDRANGLIEKVGAHTYRSPLVRYSPLDDLAALLIDCGADATWASGPTAAALHGFDGFVLKPPFHITTERGRNIQRVGHHVHTTIDLPLIDRCVVSGVRAMSPVRTVIDLAKHCSVSQITAAVDSLLRDGGGSERLLHERLVTLGKQGRHGVGKVIAAIEGDDARRGGHSWLERRFLELLAAAGLPKPTTQSVVSRAGGRLVRVDCIFEPEGVVVELLGYRWHRTEVQMSRDAERLNSIVLRGLAAIQFTHRQVTEQPDSVILTTSEALQRRRAA